MAFQMPPAALAATFAGQRYGFTLMREQKHAQPRYDHLWSGWPARLRNAFEPVIETKHFRPDPDEEDYFVEGDYRVTTGHRFIGWAKFAEKVLWPTYTVTERVPVGETVYARARPHMIDGTITFDPVHFPKSPGGSFTAVLVSQGPIDLAVIEVALPWVPAGGSVHLDPQITNT